MPSKARQALTENLKDIETLLELHESQSGVAAGRRSASLEVLNKSGIVLVTAFWEAYCEDIAAEALEFIVENTATSDLLPKEIKKIVAKELKQKPDELAIWEISDQKWRDVLRVRLQTLQESRNRKLNTPKYENIDELFLTSIGLPNISKKWVWSKKLTYQKAQIKLDAFIELRGQIAHRGQTKDSTVKKAQLVDYVEFVKQAAAKTGGSVNTHVKKVTGVDLF
jgi:DNA-binding transcriptional MerR regulator